MGSTTPYTERSAAAFGLVGHLEAYEAQVQGMSLLGFDPGRYRLLARELREINAASIALPHLSADVMDLTLRHLALVRLLCRRSSGGEPVSADPPAALLARQCELARSVHEKCMRLIPIVRCRRSRELRRASGVVHGGR